MFYEKDYQHFVFFWRTSPLWTIVIFVFGFNWLLKIKSGAPSKLREEMTLFVCCSPKVPIKLRIPDCLGYTNVDQILLGWHMRVSSARNAWTWHSAAGAVNPAWAGKQDQTTSRGLFYPQPICDPVICRHFKADSCFPKSSNSQMFSYFRKPSVTRALFNV